MFSGTLCWVNVPQAKMYNFRFIADINLLKSLSFNGINFEICPFKARVSNQVSHILRTLSNGAAKLPVNAFICNQDTPKNAQPLAIFQVPDGKNISLLNMHIFIKGNCLVWKFFAHKTKNRSK